MWKAAARLFVRVEAVSGHAGFRGKGDLLDQLMRATLSVSNNIAEGFESGTTQQLLTFIYHARGSAGEVRSMLTIMERLPSFKDLKFEISNLRLEAEGISRQLRAWADSLQNSEIKGTRYLTDEVREQEGRKERVRSLDERLKRMVEEGRIEREQARLEAPVDNRASGDHTK